MALANMRCRLRTISLLASLVVLFAVSGRHAFAPGLRPSSEETADFEELMGAKWLMCEFQPTEASGEAIKLFSYSPEADRVVAMPPEMDKNKQENEIWAALFAPSVLVFDDAKDRALWLNLNEPADDGENNFSFAISVGQVSVQPLDWLSPGTIYLNVSWGIRGKKEAQILLVGTLLVSSQKTAHGHFVSFATSYWGSGWFVAWGACTPHLGDDLRPEVARFRAEWEAADPNDKGEYDQVFWDVYDAIRLNPGDAVAYRNRGSAYHKKGDYDRAIRDYDEAIRLDPGYALAYSNRCWAYGLLRRPNEAVKDCHEALSLLPDEPEILDSRALAYWLMGEHDKAQHDLESARQLDPSRPTWQERFREFEGMF